VTCGITAYELLREAIVNVEMHGKMATDESFQHAVMCIAEGRLMRRLYIKNIQAKES
jgi:hypothetical protein